MTNKTSVVNLYKEAFDVYIGRRGHGYDGKWGNPFRIGRDGTELESIAKYKTYVLTSKELFDDLPELKGKRLGCFCKPKPCHGDVLVELIEEFYPD